MLLYGFVSAFGWWGANHFVIEPVFEKPATMEKEQQQQSVAWCPAKQHLELHQSLQLKANNCIGRQKYSLIDCK